MADWKQLLKKVLLADGKIDNDETLLLQEEFLADDVVDEEEMQFLVELRKSVKTKRAKFEDFFFSALKKHVLADGKIDAKEAAMIYDIIMADGKVDQREKKFLIAVKAEAQKCSRKFSNLFSEYL